MARILILGAGISGHTAARHLGRWLGKQHQVIVVSPRPTWNWVPSNIWVAVGEMTEQQVAFELAPLYNKLNVDFRQASALSIHPEGDGGSDQSFVKIEYTDPARAGQVESIPYDYLINATGPKLNFGATPGLGPDGYTVSVCTPAHALEANAQLQQQIAAMKTGERRTFVIGTGHGMATCQGAAFEYICNVDHALREAGVRQLARLVWLSNEYEVGDLGIGGVLITRGGYVTSGKVFVESLMADRGIEWITRAHVTKVEPGRIHYELLDGSYHELEFDFSMLIPPFVGVGLKAFDRSGTDITGELFAPNGFMKVDADYAPKPYEDWGKQDLAADLSDPGVQKHLCHRHRLCPTASHQQADEEPQWHPDQSLRGAHRYAIGDDGQGGRIEHPRHDQGRARTDPYGLHGRDGSGLHRLDRQARPAGLCRYDDGLPRGPRLRDLSRVWAEPEYHLWGDRAGRALDEVPAAPCLHLSGQAPTRLVLPAALMRSRFIFSER